MTRYNIHPRVKQAIFERDNFKCIVCGVSNNLKYLEIDHIIPISKGGSNEKDNLQTLCADCNMKKFNKVPIENIPAEEKLLQTQVIIAECLDKKMTFTEIKFILLNNPKTYLFNFNGNILENLYRELTGNVLNLDKNNKDKAIKDRLVYYLYTDKAMKAEEIAEVAKMNLKSVYNSINRVKQSSAPSD